MKFLDSFKKDVSKMDDVSMHSKPPRYWFGFGNYCLNRVMTGSFYKFMPQGRVGALAGPSGAGKSFLAGNLAKAAQEDGAFVLVIDSENSLDDDYMTKIGVDVTDPNTYGYVDVMTIPQVEKIVGGFIDGYAAEYGDNEDAHKVVIIIDSIDMLMTSSEYDAYKSGKEPSADQGQHAKQCKAMMKRFQQRIKKLNISIVITKQVYKAKQDQLLEGEGKWVITDAVRYSTSWILLVTRYKLKDSEKAVTGIRLKGEGFKTRFTVPFQSVTVEVPYHTGMDKYSGLLDVLVNLDIVKKKGAWYSTEETGSWYAKDLHKYADDLLAIAEKKSTEFLNINFDSAEYVEDMGDDGDSVKQKKQSKMGAS